MNIEYTKHISGHSLKHYTNLSVLRYNINSSMAAIDTIKEHLSDLGYGNQLKDRKEKFLIEVIAEKDRIQTYNEIVKQLIRKGVPNAIYIDDPDTVKDTFGKKVPSTVGAILFPQSQFKDVAIKVGKPVGGGGPSTAEHESYSAFCFASLLKDKKSDFSFNALAKASRLVLTSEDDIDKLFNQKITQEWKDSSVMQAKEFFRRYKLAGNSQYIVERQKEGPITAYLYKQANKFLKDLEKNATLSIFANIQLDKWNPGDIWVVHNSVNTKMFEECKTIKHLNEKILELFLVKKLIPVSLKQVKGSGNVPFEISNDGETNYYGRYVDHDLGEKGGFSFSNIQSNLHYEVVNTRSFKGTAVVRPFTKQDISAEIKGVAAAGGKAGRTFINIVLKSMGKKPILGYKDANDIIKAGKGYEALLALVLQTKFARRLPKTISEFMNKVMSKYSTNVKQKDFLRAKLQSADFCLRLEQLSKSELNELVDKSIAYASSTIKQVSSVFIKIGK